MLGLVYGFILLVDFSLYTLERCLATSSTFWSVSEYILMTIPATSVISSVWLFNF